LSWRAFAVSFARLDHPPSPIKSPPHKKEKGYKDKRDERADVDESGEQQ
jgi:hypothetical protein